MRKLIELHERLVNLDLEKELLVKEICSQYEPGELIKYRSNPNPAVDVLQLGRIREVLPWGLEVERYRPDGSRMRGNGHIRGSALVSVIKVPELDVDVV